ncbi:MAG: putative ubiquitin-protein ligase [Streblomastix strix]|uniref:HECT-type E3 ubiquitin transferase n=1 Tax=Streblomastix strix TaxID=222440 RepID=A0A5J4VD02_9EUKA|nr:MAG: putative ubiquitin-protein ligase [Streblomastix strix]
MTEQSGAQGPDHVDQQNQQNTTGTSTGTQQNALTQQSDVTRQQGVQGPDHVDQQNQQNIQETNTGIQQNTLTQLSDLHLQSLSPHQLSSNIYPYMIYSPELYGNNQSDDLLQQHSSQGQLSSSDLSQYIDSLDIQQSNQNQRSNILHPPSSNNHEQISQGSQDSLTHRLNQPHDHHPDDSGSDSPPQPPPDPDSDPNTSVIHQIHAPQNDLNDLAVYDQGLIQGDGTERFHEGYNALSINSRSQSPPQPLQQLPQFGGFDEQRPAHTTPPPSSSTSTRNVSPPHQPTSQQDPLDNEYRINLSSQEIISKECKSCEKQITNQIFDLHEYFCRIKKSQDLGQNRTQSSSSEPVSSSEIKSREYSQELNLKLDAYDPAKHHLQKFYQRSDDMLSDLTINDLIRELKFSDQYNIPASERQELLEWRIKEYKNFIQEPTPNEKNAFREGNNASKQFIRTVELIRSAEQNNNSKIDRPYLSVVPINWNDLGKATITVDRYNMLKTTELELWRLRKEKTLKQKSFVRFEQERGIDAGGLTSEWCTEYFKEATNPEKGIFRPRGKEMRLTVWGEDRVQGQYRRSPLSQLQNSGIPPVVTKDELQDEELQDLLPWWAAGVMIGKVLLLQRVSVSCRLDYSIWRQLLGQFPCLEDFGEEQKEFASSMRLMMQDPKYCKILDLTFTMAVEEEQDDNNNNSSSTSSSSSSSSSTISDPPPQKTITVPLMPDGENIGVDSQNFELYIKLYVMKKIFESEKAQKQRAALFQGFREALPFEYLFSDHSIVLSDPRENTQNQVQKYGEKTTPTQLTPKELDNIVCGALEINIDEWERFTHYTGIRGYQCNQQRVWFWNIIRRMSEKQKRDVLQFGTGERSVPIGGFARLKKNADGHPFVINWQEFNYRIENPDLLISEYDGKRESFQKQKDRIDAYIDILNTEANLHEKSIRDLNEEQINTSEQCQKIELSQQHLNMTRKDIEECQQEKVQYKVDSNQVFLLRYNQFIEQMTRLSKSLARVSSETANEMQRRADEAELEAYANERITSKAETNAASSQSSAEQSQPNKNIQRLQSRKARERLQQTLEVTRNIRGIAREDEKKSHLALMNIEQYDENERQTRLQELTGLEEKLKEEKRLNYQFAQEIIKVQYCRIENEFFKLPKPRGSSCYNVIDIPLYPSEQIMEICIIFTLNNTDNGFDFD